MNGILREYNVPHGPNLTAPAPFYFEQRLRVGDKLTVIDSAGEPEVFHFGVLDRDPERLLRHCSPAPFDRGPKTVYDASVRKTMQLDGDRIELEPLTERMFSSSESSRASGRSWPPRAPSSAPS